MIRTLLRINDRIQAHKLKESCALNFVISFISRFFKSCSFSQKMRRKTMMFAGEISQVRFCEHSHRIEKALEHYIVQILSNRGTSNVKHVWVWLCAQQEKQTDSVEHIQFWDILKLYFFPFNYTIPLRVPIRLTEFTPKSSHLWLIILVTTDWISVGLLTPGSCLFYLVNECVN